MKLNKFDEQEAVKLLGILSLYKTLQYRQLIRLFPAGKEEIINSLIRRFIRESRFFYDEASDNLSISEELLKKPDKSLITAFWVLLDFIDKAEFHTVSDYPVQISFFSADEIYEIIYIASGKEALTGYALGQSKSAAKRLVIIDSIEQIKEIAVADVKCFCIVTDGKIEYFKQNKGAV